MIPRQLFSDAVTYLRRKGTPEKKGESGFYNTVRYEELQLCYHCSEDDSCIRGDGWKARVSYGGIVLVTGRRTHYAREDLESFVVMTRLSV